VILLPYTKLPAVAAIDDDPFNRWSGRSVAAGIILKKA
jgi:hypothetical protein